jgi:NADH-quinone oxidoreductase subunit M
MDSGWLLFANIAVPIAAALIIMAIPSAYKQQVRWVATAAAFTMFVLSILIFAFYNYGEGGLQFDLRLHWLENVAFLGKDGITLHLAVDGISVPLVLLTGIVIFSGCLISWKIEYRNKDFFILLLLLVSGVFGVFQSMDLFFFFFFYELAVLPMYLLIGVWGASSNFGTYVRTKEYGAMKLTMFLVGGSVLVFIGIFATFVEANKGTFDLPVLGQVTYDETFQKTFYPLFMLGFGVLAGLWPFHTWSPDGHVAAPTAVSMLHAGVLMKLGAFGILRVGMSLFPEGAEFWSPALLVLGTTGALYGAISAMAQRDLKYVIGYSSVSHMGYVLMGLATLNPIGVNGAVLQMFAHGVMTALFFAMVGVVYDQAHTREIWSFGGLSQRMPRFVAFFAIAGLSSLGLPGLAGFVAEFNIFAGLFKTYPLFGALGIAAAAITAVYILRLLSAAFFGPLNEKWAHLKEMRLLEQLGGAVLIFFIAFMGIWPAPFVDRISQSVLSLPGIG